MWLNESKVDEMVERFPQEEYPTVHVAAQILSRYRDWVNSNSDGWPYWKAGLGAAGQLMERLHISETALRNGPGIAEYSDLELSVLIRPMEDLIRKQGGDPGVVLSFPRAVTVPAAPPRVTGTIVRSGVESSFSITEDGYQQWGADNKTLGARVDLVTSMMVAFADWEEGE